MNYVFVDLEMTCFESKMRTDKEDRLFVFDGSNRLILNTNKTEIIEIGAVKLNDNKEVIDTFQKFVKPMNSILSKKCKKITSIKQEDVNKSNDFLQVMDEFIDWIGEEEFVFCAWSTDDQRQIIREAKFKNYDSSKIKKLFSNYYVLQEEFSQAYNAIKNISSRDTYSLKTSLELMKIDYDKPLHRAINDAIATSKLYIKFLNIENEIPKDESEFTINDLIDPFIKKRLEAVFNIQI